MQKPVLVIGHKNPDTDSICAAIGYAYLKNALGVEAIPARAGQINPETKFVLDYFKVPAPRLVEDLYLRASDIKLNTPPCVNQNDSLRELGKIFVEKKPKAVPVMDDNNSLIGLVTATDLANRYYEELAMQNLSDKQVTYANIAATLEASFKAGEHLKETFIEGEVKIAASSTHTFASLISQGDLAIVGDRFEAQLAALRAGAVGLILTTSTEPDILVVEEANRRNAVILTTPHGTYRTSRLINQSIPVRTIMHTDLMCFKSTDLVEDIKQKMLSTGYRTYPVLENGHYIGLLDRGKFIIPERQEVILVDHNEHSQAVEGIEEAHILEIVDHHRLGGLKTGDPLFIRLDTVGSTSTIIANMAFHRDVVLPREIAGVLLSAIISDTLFFRSPTCTHVDKDTVAKLVKLAEIENLEEFAMAVLKSGSIINILPPAEIIRSDVKEFFFDDYKVAITQITIMDRESVLKKSSELQNALRDFCKEKSYDFTLLMATDILNQNTDLFFAGFERSRLDNAFGVCTDNTFYHLQGVMSRKKQIVPLLAEALRD